MLFDLSSLVPIFSADDLNNLVAPFSETEINNIIRIMPADKAPGPDGFNGLFIKKCWHIIKEDIYRLIQDFAENLVDL